MKNWKKAIGFLITGVVAIIAFVITGFLDSVPDWFNASLPIISAICEVLGIVFINPFQKQIDKS